jgi:hypothetical protein
MGRSSPLWGGTETWWRDGERRDEGPGQRRAQQAEPIPDMRPWLEVGWIFRDGDAQAIERQGNRTRVRPPCHGRDE